MKKLLLLSTIFLTLSCGVIKKDKQSIKKEKISDFNGSKLDYKRLIDSSFTLKPFDPTKPMLIGKDTIVNVMIENHYRERLHIVKDTVVKKETQFLEVESKNKETDNSKVYLYLFGFGFGFLAIIIIVILTYLTKQK